MLDVANCLSKAALVPKETGFGVVELMAERHVYVLQRQTRGRLVDISKCS